MGRSCWCGEKNAHFEPLPATCDGSGFVDCRCGGDFCVCHNHGELECFGCLDCRPLEDESESDEEVSPVGESRREFISIRAVAEAAGLGPELSGYGPPWLLSQISKRTRRYWRAFERARRLEARVRELEAQLQSNAAADALDKIAELCGCPEWEYPGQVVRDVEAVIEAAKEIGVEACSMTPPGQWGRRWCSTHNTYNRSGDEVYCDDGLVRRRLHDAITPTKRDGEAEKP